MIYRLLLTLCLIFNVHAVSAAQDVVAQAVAPSVGQEIAQNCTSIANNMCQLVEHFTQQLGSCAHLLTKLVAGASSVAARYPKTAIAATVSALLYSSWRTYQTVTVEHYIRDARIFLRPVLPNGLDPLAGNSHLKIRNINIAQASKNEITPYLERIEVLKNGLATQSYFAQWVDEIKDLHGMAYLMDMNVALTDNQIQIVERYIQPRIACLGLPMYHDYMQMPYVWSSRLSAPFNNYQNYRDIAGSYIGGLLSPYTGEATNLTWQLFKYEKQLRARLHQLA
ncbi:MAG: hypothetical protein WD055_06350 [Candidatus Dependentiae bacterium]